MLWMICREERLSKESLVTNGFLGNCHENWCQLYFLVSAGWNSASVRVVSAVLPW